MTLLVGYAIIVIQFACEHQGKNPKPLTKSTCSIIYHLIFMII